jgi:hypothetical protein
MQVIVLCGFQLLGPTNQCHSNSRYYSGQPPLRLRSDIATLPHVTIQCPVYTEGLEAVIEPTIKSLKAAIATYEMQGGSASIFINDDGMQTEKDPLAIQMRKDFYKANNIGWVARPIHSPNADDPEKRFVRRGRFKKVSTPRRP